MSAEPFTPAQRTMRARVAAYSSWATTPDRAERTRPARDAQMRRFENQVDPDGTLSPQERARRAEAARKAYFAGLSLKASRARQARRATSTTVSDAEVSE